MQITDGYSLFFHCWPWMGLGAAIVLLIMAFTTNVMRSDASKPRWKDPTFVAWMGAIAYMLHNFEEYGVDFAGQTLGFAYMMNDMGMTEVTEGAYLGCNIPFVWVLGPLLAVLSRKRPELVGAMPIFAMVNGLSHCVQLANVGYNPGVATGLVIFIPLGIYTIVTFYGKGPGKFAWKYFWLTFMVAFGYMVVIMSGIGLSVAGVLVGSGVQFAFVSIGTALIGWLWWVAAKKARPNAA